MQLFVGLSGGVDSSVAALLLKEAGHEVHGVFMRVAPSSMPDCPWREDRLAAKRTAAYLGIPFIEVDLTDAYERAVIRPMVEGYARGETPNPDVWCNERIKFAALFDALPVGAHLATGHYTRVIHGERHTLHTAVDKSKDQTYFLARVTSERLARVHTPLGVYTKEQVRKKAAQAGLPSAVRKDSQGLCFLGGVTIKDFLGAFIPLHPGTVFNEAGAPIGTHDGAVLYTIGSRHGFSVPGAAKALYVVEIDTARNALVVSESLASACATRICVSDAIFRTPLAPRASVTFETRYHQGAQRGALLDTCTLLAEVPQVVAPGQTVALYQNDECVGSARVSRCA